MEMMEQAMDHDGFSVIECLSECTEFYPGAFDAADEVAAYKLALEPFPGYFGVFYQNQRPTKNALEGGLIAAARQRTNNAGPRELLQKTFQKFS